jgi:hypothetical protein
MEPKAPAMLLVLIESVRLRWFVASIGLDGRTTPLICSEVDDLEKYRGLDFDEQVAFLRHRFCGVLQRGCDRLWARNLKACQFVFVFEGLLAEPTGKLTSALAQHFAEWMLNPPVVVLADANGFNAQQPPQLDQLAGRLEPPLKELLVAHFGELLAAKEDPTAWEHVRKHGVWCVQKEEG